jgi:RIO-like serine/threonine protein kinase
VSFDNLTEKGEKKIVNVFDAIHSLGVMHGDIRKQNILVGDNDSVWIIDFEMGYHIPPEWNEEQRKEMIASERTNLEYLLSDIRANKQERW